MNNIFTINWQDLPPPKSVNSSYIMHTLRFKFMAWMCEDTYRPYLVHTDHMAITDPKFAQLQTYGFITPLDTLMRTFKGSNDESNGPNGETQCPML